MARKYKEGSAVLFMDCQNDIVERLPGDKQKLFRKNASLILEAARRAALPVFFMVARFREGYPELSPTNRLLSVVPEWRILQEGTRGAELIPELAPRTGEPVVVKRRVSGFAGTELQTLLQVKGVRRIVLLGTITSGCILSDARAALDMDFDLTIISDACADFDDEVHRVLMEKVFPTQATVLTTGDFLRLLR